MVSDNAARSSVIIIVFVDVLVFRACTIVLMMHQYCEDVSVFIDLVVFRGCTIVLMIYVCC